MSSLVVLELIILSLECPFELDVLIDHLDVLLEGCHRGDTNVVLALVPVAKLEVHNGGLVERRWLRDGVLELETGLHVLRIQRRHQTHHVVGIAHPDLVRWVDLQIHVVDVHHPVRFKGALKDGHPLLFSSHFLFLIFN